jgi:isoleucyl-tRNA synthetase
VNARTLGPRLGKHTKQVIQASKQGQWRSLEGGGVEVAGQVLTDGEYSLLLQPRDGVACEPLPSNDAIVVLDLTLSEELLQEGQARDVVRAVQQARKQADLHISDRIRLELALPQGWREAVERFRDYVSEQTLASELEIREQLTDTSLFVHEANLAGQQIRIGVARI